jgi:hypothetical protein
MSDENPITPRKYEKKVEFVLQFSQVSTIVQYKLSQNYINLLTIGTHSQEEHITISDDHIQEKIYNLVWKSFSKKTRT